MSETHTLPSMNLQPPPRPLIKHRSWSPDVGRDEAWRRRKNNQPKLCRRSRSVTEDDLEELKGCIELGFGFLPESPELEPKLADTLPALGFYCAVNRQYSSRLSRTSSVSSIMSDHSDVDSTGTIFDQGDDEETMKKKLAQWAQVVACSVKQLSGEPISN